jgi:2-polyprenyl-6-methoxyphenol hydroxylase-like FAD-dependent oxidoreductase
MPSQNAAVPAFSRSTDALIVGGGPAGLAASIALRQRGIGCTVVEARPRGTGIDKACGEGLMPDALHSLRNLGVELTSADGEPFRGIRFRNATHSVEADFPDGAGLGVRRPHLHRLLAERAEASGATLLWNTRVELSADLGSRTAIVDGQPMRFRWLIGADGHASSVRRWAGLDRVRTLSRRYGFRTHFRVPAAETAGGCVEVHWAPSGQLYLTPVAPDCLCVVFLTRDRRLLQQDRANLLAAFPEVAARLAGAEIVSQQRGAVSATCKLRRVASEFVALLGDASGSADSITGEGLAICFRQAHALAESIACGSLAPYGRAHTAIGRLPHRMGSLMLTLDRFPAVQTHALRALAASPALFQDLLRVHVGEKALPSVLLRRGPRFGWSLVTRAAQPTQA